MIKFCLPITDIKSVHVVDNISDNLDAYDCFEVWIDYIKDFKLELLDTLASFSDKEIIVLFRRRRLAPIRMPYEQRVEILKQLSNSKIMIDLDVSTQEAELKYIVEHNLPVKLIVSYHNYKATPRLEELREIRSKMSIYSPEIFKISTYCQDEAAIFRLMSILSDCKVSGHRFIVTGMGEFGKIVRVVGAEVGNAFNFAPLSKSAETADAQLTLDQFKKIISVLEIKNAR